MLVVGLTGGIASGKSTVSRLIQERHHIPLIDLDLLARQVVEPGTTTLIALVKAFGAEILQPDGTLNRPALGRIAFGDESKRKELNKITHSAIRKRMVWLLIGYWLRGTRIVVVDTPLLVEAGLWKWCGEAVLVWCSAEDQLKRMLLRDTDKGLTEEDARSRLAAQWDLNKKKNYADVVLDNSKPLRPHEAASNPGTKDEDSLEEQVQRLVARWRRQTASVTGVAKWLVAWLVPPVGLLMGYLFAKRREWEFSVRLRTAGEDAKAE
ncbi:CoaE-domain-containing protein [Tilletiaria anomala UBC 951]|uniref:CoaE-domain-containing protein n=1 Tax=Tilletiaria anomala (strain ATCC 24038 / CBS 436.72 / UBC 951) TaxID=1037660 RepID=A0A066W461_TILAU|nr:CoaE-domain-containing protein [Tilletiaria anomala UBC 951]KDN47323.1 CoaE-domain-containing protein [Tilletiaria anomala UBC 951]